ncbi:hypothetical protein Pan44_30960 [Caulifigura coniformis]|uniref:Uncharacterized protein n=1 Tax=Caulifigura coniformis TaxID=2527983 RepID=A0A517SFZ1_9PLAN|nr:hypothetical protein [Caulifigura coniformis]QDT55055.1 hypothetical protein Pan44_30960 [Caulifigura coniformis]
MNHPPFNSPERSPGITRRSLLAATGALFVGVRGAHTQANERPRAFSPDPVLLEWSTSVRGASTRHTRLRIYSSGLLESWPVGRGNCQREHRTPEEARRLSASLAAAIRDASLTSEAIDSDLREQSRRTGLSFLIQDADDSVLQVLDETTRLEIRCPAPPLLAERFPEAGKLQEFVRLERQLCNLSCIVLCGGQDAAELICRQANDGLKSEHPHATPWTTGDLMMVRSSLDGGRFVQFRREHDAAEQWTTCVMESPGRAPRVTVIPPASLAR